MWKKLWRLPQSELWRETGCEDTVGLYVRFMLAAASDSPPRGVISEITRLDAQLGLSPKALQAMRVMVRDLPRLARPDDQHFAEAAQANVTKLRQRVPAQDES